MSSTIELIDDLLAVIETHGDARLLAVSEQLLARLREEATRRSEFNKVRLAIRAKTSDSLEIALLLLQALEPTSEECSDIVPDIILAMSSISSREWKNALGVVGAIPLLAEEVAKELVGATGDLSLRQLASLSPSIAEVFATHKGNLDLGGLSSLSDGAAEALALHEGELRLTGLRLISDTAAQALSRHDGPLRLSGLIGLSDNAAAALAGHTGELCLASLQNQNFSDAAAIALAQRSGELNAPAVTARWQSLRLKKISTSTATALAKVAGKLDLSGLRKLPAGIATALASHSGHLVLNGITELSDNACKALSRHNGAVELRGLTELSECSAKYLAKNPEISVSESVEPVLTKAKREIRIDEAAQIPINESKLNTLTAAEAEILARSPKHELKLRSLTDLPDDVAKSLSAFQGTIQLDGLTEISDEALRSLLFQN